MRELHAEEVNNVSGGTPIPLTDQELSTIFIINTLPPTWIK